MINSTLRIPMLAVLAALLSAGPVLAQKGNGRGNDRDRGRSEEVRRERDRDRDGDERWDRDDDDRRDARRGDRDRFNRRANRRVPPGWCRGVGNPHRTAANCGTHTDRIWRDRDGTWRDRNG